MRKGSCTVSVPMIIDRLDNQGTVYFTLSIVTLARVTRLGFCTETGSGMDFCSTRRET